MRTYLVLAIIAAALAFAGTAVAQNNPSPKAYEASFEEIGNSCTEVGLQLTKAKIELTRKGGVIKLDIPGVPSMNGKLRRGGSFKAEGKKTSAAAKDVEGRFSAAGRASATKLQLVFVAEFYRGTKPLCTQSWDVTGVHK